MDKDLSKISSRLKSQNLTSTSRLIQVATAEKCEYLIVMVANTSL